MRKALALALALLHLAQAADATTYYVNHALGNNNNAGTSAGSGAWQTIAKANATAAAGDVVVIASSDTIYASAIAPVANSVTFIGDSTNAQGVKVPGVSINTNRILINGVRVWGSTVVYSNDGNYFHMRNSEIVGSFDSSIGNFTLDNVRIGIGLCAYTSRFTIAPDSLFTGDSVVVMNCGMNLRTWGDPKQEKIINWEPKRVYGPTDKDWYFSANRCTMTVMLGQNFEKVAMWNHMRRANFNSNYWLMRDSSGIAYGQLGSGVQGFVLRDSIKECKFTNDTYEMWSPNHIGKLQALMYSSGSHRADSANTWKFCTFKTNINTAGAPGFWNEWFMAYRDSIYRNTFLCDTESPCYQVEGSVDSGFIYRNTFVNTGGGAAFKIIPDGNTASEWGGGTITALGNVYYAKGGAGAAEIYTPSYASGLVLTDYNTLFLPVLNGQDKAFYYDNWGVWPHGFRRVGDPSCPQEQHSTWGSPAFIDSTYAGFDGNLQQVSAARGVGPSGVDCGAYDYATPAPGAVSNLVATAISSSSVLLTWTAPGFSGFSGTATSYDVRYSTSEVTDGTFSSATTVTGEPTPGIVGTVQSMTITGLSASTTYYFGLQSGNGTSVSLTSNSPSVRTWPSNSVEP